MSKKPTRPARLPKPPGVRASPRFHTKNRNAEKEDALQAVRKLTDAELQAEHVVEYGRQIKSKRHPRGSTLLTIINTENALRYALAKRMATSYGNREIFGPNGPLGTFDQRIRLGMALQLYGQQVRGNLEIIRTVRNAFAHSTIPITFNTPQIKQLCLFLEMPFILHPRAVRVKDGKVVPDKVPKNARTRFIKTCEAITHNLLINARHSSQRPKSHSDFGHYEVWLKLPALP